MKEKNTILKLFLKKTSKEMRIWFILRNSFNFSKLAHFNKKKEHIDIVFDEKYDTILLLNIIAVGDG
jgi:Mg2+/Co2+ transporter CorB